MIRNDGDVQMDLYSSSRKKTDDIAIVNFYPVRSKSQNREILLLLKS